MKKLLLLLTVLISRTASAQNWNLFPLNQKSYYYEHTPWDDYVDLYLMDSVKVSGQDTILYSRRNLNLQGAGTCYIDTLQSMNWSQNNLYYMDSLVQRNDTIFYLSNLSTTPFYFLPHATVGQSWTVSSTYVNNDYNQITITCSSIQVQTFFGITDSVKIFTMTPNGTSTNQTPVSNFVMRLSKSHGLIEYVPFILFLYHPFYVNFTSFQLIGIDSAGNVSGYRQPKLHDYFHLSVGDILLWQRIFDPDNWMQASWMEYYQDSITQVLIANDSVIYTFDRARQDSDNVITYQYGMTSKFLKTEFENIIETPPNWIGLGNNRFSSYYTAPHNNVLYWQSSIIGLKIGIDTTSIFSFSNSAYSVDTINCQPHQVLDISFGFTVDTRAGVNQYCYYNFAYDCVTLIGSLINGQQIGNISLSVKGPISSNISSLQIIPNPSSDLITIRNLPTSQITTCVIYDSFGRLVKHESISDNSLSVKYLSNGLYLIRISTDKGTTSGKFVKN